MSATSDHPASNAFEAYRALFWRHPQPMWVFEIASLRFLDVNDAACDQYGYTREQFLAMTANEIRPPQDQRLYFEFVHNLAADAPATPTLWRHKRADGTLFYADVVSQAIDYNGTPARVVIATDASARLAVSRALSESRAALAEAQELAHLGSFDADLVRDEIRWSAELFRIFGVDPARERPSRLQEFDHPEDRAQVSEEVKRARTERSPYTTEHRIVRRDGVERVVFERGQFFYKEGATEPSRVVGAVLDITERKRAEERLRMMAEHDPLTELPNRTLLADRLIDAIARARRAGGGVGVLFLDLDRFKAINDTIGHGAGDKLLCQLAARLRERIPSAATIARPGGDEFIVVIEPLASKEAGEAVARELLAAVAEPLPYESTHLIATASIGLSFFPGDGETPDELLRSADIAMYAAKATGGNAWLAFSAAMHEKAIAALEMEHALRSALDRGAIEVYYQPIVDARTNEVASLEALVRWTENGRAVAPNDFIPLAEESGIIVALGTYVLERACAMGAELTATHPNLTMCVNISARQFREVEFAARVAQALHRSGLDPGRLQLEITESAYISAELGVRNVEALDELGVQLSIDDFGTGYSALGYLKRLPLDALKIDRSFVADIVTDAADQAIVRAIIAVARNLDLEVIGEGVETAEQAAMLRMLGCTHLQGFYFSRPLPPPRLVEFLQT